MRLRVPLKPAQAEATRCRPRITVLLADDHGLVRRGFRRMLDDDPEIVVVGEAADGAEAIALARRADAAGRSSWTARCRRRTGIEAARSILAESPEVAILMLSMHSERTLAAQALAAGARGYILKSAIDLDLAAAVKRVAAGETVARSSRRSRHVRQGRPPSRPDARGSWRCCS